MSDFATWAKSEWGKLQRNLSPTNDNNEIDPVRLNQVLTSFAGAFSWMITIAETETNKLNHAQHVFDKWYKQAWYTCEAKIREEMGGGTGRVTNDSIKSRITKMYGDEEDKAKLNLLELQSRVALLKGFVKTLEKQASILQSLSSNMRSEMFFAGGVPINEKLSENQRNTKSKQFLRKAIRAQNPDFENEVAQEFD